MKKIQSEVIPSPIFIKATSIQGSHLFYLPTVKWVRLCAISRWMCVCVCDVMMSISCLQTAREFPLAYLTNEQEWIEANEKKNHIPQNIVLCRYRCRCHRHRHRLHHQSFCINFPVHGRDKKKQQRIPLNTHHICIGFQFISPK